MIRTIALLALVAAASATFYKPKCPMVPGKYPFDMDKFQGDWFLAAANEETVALKGKCVKITFPTFAKDDKKDEAILSSRMTGVSTKDNSAIAYEAFFQPIISDKIANMYSAFRKEGTSAYSSIYKTSIVSTDYTNYAVVMSCKSAFDGETKKFTRGLFAEIWTRAGITLSKDTMDTILVQLASYDIEPTFVKPVETKC